MTKIDFYILPESQVEQRHLFTCRLVEKAFKHGHEVYIHHDDEAQANAINELLWSFRNSSFIPHQLTSDSAAATVAVGYQQCPQHHHDVLINLSSKVPEFFSRFERVSEIVVQDPAVTAVTRENYRFYRDRGYPLKSHDLRQ